MAHPYDEALGRLIKALTQLAKEPGSPYAGLIEGMDELVAAEFVRENRHHRDMRGRTPKMKELEEEIISAAGELFD